LSLAVDGAGNLYVVQLVDSYNRQIRKRDAQGNWSVIATQDARVGRIGAVQGFAADAAGNLYLGLYLGYNSSLVLKRDAQGNWSVIAVAFIAPVPTAVAVDAMGNLYVADSSNGRLEQRDAQGNWSVLATRGDALGQFDVVSTLAADAEGNLYVGDVSGGYDPFIPHGLQKRDAQGDWSVIATPGTGNALGQVYLPSALAVDMVGNLYVADRWRMQQRDAQGNWSWVLPQGALALAADPAGNLYARVGGAIWKRDDQGNWSVIAPQGAYALAADAAGNLYIAAYPIQKRDAQDNWFVIGTAGLALDEVWGVPSGLAVDSTGNLYVADTGNHRVQVYRPHP
jgi:sugar lactone lactonase YvrE